MVSGLGQLQHQLVGMAKNVSRRAWKHEKTAKIPISPCIEPIQGAYGEPYQVQQAQDDDSGADDGAEAYGAEPENQAERRRDSADWFRVPLDGCFNGI